MLLLIFLTTFVVLILSFVVVIYWKLIRPEKNVYDKLRSQGIPGEPFVPIIGQLPQIRRARENGLFMDYLLELYQKHGSIFLFSFGPLVRIIINEPDILADVLGRSNAEDYVKPDLFVNVFKPLIGSHNLLVSGGMEHERARKMLNPAFHFTNLKSMISIMATQTTKAIDGYFISADSKSVDLQKELSTLTLSIIVSSAFGKNLETISNFNNTMYETIAEVFEAIRFRSVNMIIQIPLLARLPFWRKNIIDKGSRRISHYVEQIITDRREGQSTSLCAGDDLLDVLLSAVDTEGRPFTDEEVKDQALTFVLAGHETTSNLMAWTLYVLMTNESVLRACRDEVDKVLPNGIEPSYEHMNDLVVCEAILHETLRLYPPAPLFVRKCIREHTVGREGCRQVRIPVGTTVVINSYGIHRRADLWPRPLEFDYTRWIRDPVTGHKPKLAHPFCYLPFAAGPRNCIGQNFALLEAKVILAILIQRCDFMLEAGQNITPEFVITMRPKYGLRAQVTKRL